MKIENLFFMLISIILLSFLISCSPNNETTDELAFNEIALNCLNNKYTDNFTYKSITESKICELTYNSQYGDFLVKLNKETKTMTDNYLSLYYNSQTVEYFFSILSDIYGNNVKVFVDTSHSFWGTNDLNKPENVSEYLTYCNIVNITIFTSSSIYAKDSNIETFREAISKTGIRTSTKIYYVPPNEINLVNSESLTKKPSGFFKTDISGEFTDYIWY